MILFRSGINSAIEKDCTFSVLSSDRAGFLAVFAYRRTPLQINSAARTRSAVVVAFSAAVIVKQLGVRKIIGEAVNCSDDRKTAES